MANPNDPIKHVVLLMMENHSFDQMLGCFSELYTNLDGIDKTATNRFNVDSKGNKYYQKETREKQMDPSPMHEFVDVKAQLEGGNSGFVKDYEEKCSSKPEALQNIMGYYPLDFLPALHALGRDFKICDHWYSSLPGPTWPNRMFGLTGTSNGSTVMPEGLHQLEMLINQTQTTIFDRLNEGNKSWCIYYYDFPASLLLRNQHKAQNLSKYKKIKDFFKDVRGEEDKFPEFTFIEPKYFGGDENDDHPPHNIFKAQKLIADVYNAIRSNPKLWETTLLVIYYDEHGGFHDHVTPPAAEPPDDKTQEYAFNQYGVRVPAILISPWVGKGCENSEFDHTSLLKYLQEKWSLGSLGNRTSKAKSIGFLIDQKEPRKDTIPFIRVPYSDLMPDHPELDQESESAHQNALHMLGAVIKTNISTIGDAAAADIVRGLAIIAPVYARIKAAIGRAFIKVGQFLTRDLRDHQSSKVQDTISAGEIALKKGSS